MAFIVATAKHKIFKAHACMISGYEIQYKLYGIFIEN